MTKHENNELNPMIYTVLPNDAHQQAAVIKVVGVGGGGGNAIKHMIEEGLEGVEFIVMNTDVQANNSSPTQTKIQLGAELTKGLGAGANPEVGYESAVESIEEIRHALIGADVVFIAVGMGGGTGTGASPIIAQVAKEQGALTIAVVTKPSLFEGKKRMRYAEEGIKLLTKHIDSLIVLPNDKLQKSLPPKTTFLDALKASNNVLYNAISGFTAIINEEEGLINLDFADLKTINTGDGVKCVMGIGEAKGENRIEKAVNMAMSCPLIEDIELTNIGRMLVHLVVGDDFSFDEFNQAGDCLKQYTAEDSEIIIGVTTREKSDIGVHITVIATGFLETMNAQDNFELSVQANVSPTATREQTKLDNNKNLDQPAYLRKETYLDIAKFLSENADK